MARKKRRGLLTCCCIVPLVLLVVFVGTVFGLYAWLPIGTTLGMQDTELIGGKTMKELGIHDKSLRQFLRSPIKDLGSLGEVELMEGSGFTLNGAGLKNNSVRDIGRKQIKDLGFYDIPFVDIFGGMFSDAKLSDGGDAPEFDFMGALGSLSFKTLGLGSERLLDTRMKNLIAIGQSALSGGGDDMFDMVGMIAPILGKKISNLGNGNFKDIDLLEIMDFDVVSFLGDDVPEEFSDLLEDMDFSGIFRISNIRFKNNASILDMTLIDLFTNIGEIDFDTMLADITDSLLNQIFVDDEEILGEIFEDLGVKDQGELDNLADKGLDDANNDLAGMGTADCDCPTTVSGTPIVDRTSGEPIIDYLLIFQEEIHTCVTGSQFTLDNFRLIGIFNSLLDDPKFAELKDMGAKITAVIIKKVGNEYTVDIELEIKTPQELLDIPVIGSSLKPTQRIGVVRVISVDEFGVMSTTRQSETIRSAPHLDNLILGGEAPEGDDDSLGEYIGRMLGEMFCTLVNNFGSIDRFEEDVVAVGEEGNDILGTIIYINLRTTTHG